MHVLPGVLGSLIHNSISLARLRRKLNYSTWIQLKEQHKFLALLIRVMVVQSLQSQRNRRHILKGMRHNNGAILGSEIVVLSSHGFLLKATKIEEPRRRARAVLEFGNHVKEEPRDSKDNYGVQEDVVDPDYEPPHRSPPIHNKQT
ncbi:hypothetical protein L1049_019785 [Liquidambar formosana]|uniref:Uncharacterized protein n=1 Tax=Liquidambar formosana TaxID=63359 RepID=A0AAP0XAD4_LIQFO